MTEESSRALDRSLVSGIAWTVVLRWVAKAVSWTATLYVARVLSPADFGIVAMATVPIGLARLMGDFGLEAILVQNRALGQAQLAALASTALVLAGAMAALFIALARPISWYFREPAVAAIVVVLSLTFVTDALQLLPRALLQRDLRFQTLAWLNGLQAVIGAVVLAGLASLSFGYWALTLNTVVTAVVSAVYGLGEKATLASDKKEDIDKLLKQDKQADQLFDQQTWRTLEQNWQRYGTYYDPLVHDAEHLRIGPRSEEAGAQEERARDHPPQWRQRGHDFLLRRRTTPCSPHAPHAHLSNDFCSPVRSADAARCHRRRFTGTPT